jgi:hypothetical protein
MATPTNVADFLDRTREHWAKNGPPAETWNEAGDFWKQVGKSPVNDWIGKGVALLPVATSLPGNMGPNVYQAFSLSIPSGLEQFQIPIRENWAYTQFEQFFLEMLSSPSADVGQMVGKNVEMANTAKGFNRVGSYQVWGDGTGRIAKGDGVYDPAATNVITFKNRVCANFFEVGDVLVFIAANAAVPAGGQPTPRAGSVTVTAVDVAKGKVTVNGANVQAGIADALNTDYIGKATFFTSAEVTSKYKGLMDGYFRWIPITSTEAATTLFNVNRGSHPARLSGRRIKLTGNEGPWEIFSELMRVAKEAGAINTVWVPGHVIRMLILEMKAQGVTVIPYTTTGDRAQLTIGVELVKVVAPGMPSVIIAVDNFMCDPNVSEDEDYTFVGMHMDNVKVVSGPTGIGWKNYDGQAGPHRQVIGGTTTVAQYGAFWNFMVFNPAANVITSTRADD